MCLYIQGIKGGVPVDAPTSGGIEINPLILRMISEIGMRNQGMKYLYNL